jgi:hypothetical protein
MSGKGDTPRPLSVDAETFASNWDLIFKKPVVAPVENPVLADDKEDLCVRPGQDAA